MTKRRRPRPRPGRFTAGPVLLALAAVGAVVLAVKEYPALRREIKIWLM